MEATQSSPILHKGVISNAKNMKKVHSPFSKVEFFYVLMVVYHMSVLQVMNTLSFCCSLIVPNVIRLGMCAKSAGD